MKKYIALLLSILLLASLCACTAKPTEPATPTDAQPSAPAETTDAQITVGIAIPTVQESIWVAHGDALTKYAEERGWNVILQCANGDNDKQYGQIENMLTTGIDVLILAAADTGAIGKAIDACHKEDVLVIGYDRLDTNDAYDLFLTFNNVEVGRLMAEYAISQRPTGNYCLLGGDITNQPGTNDIHTGMIQALTPYVENGDITIIADQNCKNWASDEGLAHCENALTANGNQIDAVPCANDGIAGGAIQALDSAGLAGSVIVTGQYCETAAIQRVAAGTQSMTEYKSADALAKATIDAAAALLAGEQLDNINADYDGIPAIELAPVVITKDNLDALLIDTGFITREEVYG